MERKKYCSIFCYISFNFSIGHAEYIARTDLAISHLEPWRAEIPVKFFASRIRFQIRIDDLRALVRNGQAQIDDILGMYIQSRKMNVTPTVID